MTLACVRPKAELRSTCDAEGFFLLRTSRLMPGRSLLGLCDAEEGNGRTLNTGTRWQNPTPLSLSARIVVDGEARLTNLAYALLTFVLSQARSAPSTAHLPWERF